jgi:hypothetical protein
MQVTTISLLTFSLSYMVYNQIWLNLHEDDHQFGYITRLKKKEALTWMIVPWKRFLNVLVT